MLEHQTYWMRKTSSGCESDRTAHVGIVQRNAVEVGFAGSAKKFPDGKKPARERTDPRQLGVWGSPNRCCSRCRCATSIGCLLLARRRRISLAFGQRIGRAAQP